MKTTRLFLSILILIFISFSGNSQCTVHINARDTTTFCAGDSVTLVAAAIGGGSVLDQSQLVYNAGTSARTLSGYSEWQSFTAGITGTLNEIDMGFFNTINGSGTLNIFTGTGTGGTLLQSQNVTVFCAGGNCLLPFIVSAPVTAGQVYTFQFIPGAGMPDPYGVQVENPGTYTGGEMDLVDPSGTYPTGFDMVFQTHVGTSFYYLWSNGSTTDSITVSASGNYMVTVTDSAGCSVSDSVLVTVNPAPPIPIITANDSTHFCIGDSVMLAASGAGSFLWSTGDTTSSITVFTSGSYSVTATNGNGCSSQSPATNVIADTIPNAVLSDSAYPPGYNYLYILPDSAAQYIWISPFSILDSTTNNQDTFWCLGSSANRSIIFFWGDVRVVIVTEGGCRDTSNLVSMQYCSGGINQIGSLPDFTLTPNPANDYVTIGIEGSVIGSTLYVTDITGRKIDEAKLETLNYKLQTTNFSTGIYFIRISDDKGNMAVKKMVKQ